jgi:hypothetical protein
MPARFAAPNENIERSNPPISSPDKRHCGAMRKESRVEPGSNQLFYSMSLRRAGIAV